jgi:ribosomal protein S18 acetylase RimI-like enzyme
VLGCHSLASPNANLLQKDWVGFVVIIAPSPEGVNSNTQPASTRWEMAALYVKPEVRGQGQGRRLVEATIDLVKEHGFIDENQTPFCLTSVRHGNDNALELYQKLGFRIIDPNEHIEKEGREYLATALRIDF